MALKSYQILLFFAVFDNFSDKKKNFRRFAQAVYINFEMNGLNNYQKLEFFITF